MLLRPLIFFAFFLLQTTAFSQTSIHMEENQKYNAMGVMTDAEYDAISGFELMKESSELKSSGLEKIVFGYHPFWGGSKYLNYQWDLLSDLSYFSYEVDPATGNASSMHDWLTSPAIDSAFANGTRVHLCVTLFSGQSLFFNNPVARETLTNNLINLVIQRGAHGVSLDFEAVPTSQGDNMLAYIGEFATAFHDSIPDGILSIAMPAVDWGGIFDVEVLNQYIDLYMIMGYDYYWNSSSQAGPVDPHYSMTSGYNYSVSRTISYYQSQGMPLDKMLIGVPYYSREWATASGTAPSSTTGHGVAKTWSYIQNNTSGNYSSANHKREPNSFGPYFAYENDGWHQCFVNDVHSLSRRYKMVNSRGIAGIGIWALGYDNGYIDLWQLIGESFAQGTQSTSYDSIFDSGGPTWEYYNQENYVETYHAVAGEGLKLVFSDFNLELGYDSLWVYSGYYPGGELLGAYTGSTLPPELNADEVLSIHFKSDNLTTAAGWTAYIGNFNVSTPENQFNENPISVYPNPASSTINIEYEANATSIFRIYDLHGKMMIEKTSEPNSNQLRFDISQFSAGIYLVVGSDDHSVLSQQKVVVFH